MLVADTYLGSLADGGIAERVDATDSLRVVLDDTDRQRSRVRTTTVDGIDLGITVGRELQDEDVLVARNREDDDGEQLIVVELDGIPAVELSFDDVARDALPAAVALGHAIGNRHRELVVTDDCVLVRAEQDRNQLDSLLAEHLPDGTTTEQTTVPPSAFDSDAGHTGHTHASPDHSHMSSEHSHTSSDHSHTSSDHHTEGHTAHPHSHDHSEGDEA